MGFGQLSQFNIQNVKVKFFSKILFLIILFLILCILKEWMILVHPDFKI